MQRILLLTALLVAACAAAPATQPTTAPSSVVTLGETDVRVSVPARWTQVARSNDGRMLAFSLAASKPIKATMAVNIDPQQFVLKDSDAPKIGQSVCEKIRANAEKNGTTLETPPTIEKDPRFFVRVHHTFKKGEQRGDQLQLYRAIGVNLVAVAVTAYTDSEEQAQEVFAEAETILLGATGGGSSRVLASTRTSKAPAKLADKPVALPAAKIKLQQPDAWRSDISGSFTGMLVTYHDPADSTGMIALSARELPKEAKSDPSIRDGLIDHIASGETAQFKIEGAEVVGKTTTIVDRRFLRKVRTTYQSKESRAVVSSRQILVGDRIMSVSVVCLEDRFDSLDKLADALALTIRPAK